MLVNSSSATSTSHWARFVFKWSLVTCPWSLVRNSFREKFKNDLLWVIFTPWAVIYKVCDFLQNWRVTWTPTLDLRVLCERPLTIVSWIVSELRRYGLGLQPILHLFQFSPKILNVFFLLPSASAKRAGMTHHLLKSTSCAASVPYRVEFLSEMSCPCSGGVCFGHCFVHLYLFICLL